MELSKFRGIDQQIVVETSEGKPVYMLVAENGDCVRLSSSAYYLLKNIYNGLSFDNLAAILSQQQNRSVSPEEVELAYNHVIERLGKLDENPSQQQLGFWIRFTLLPQYVVAQFAKFLAIAFQPLIFCFFTASSVIATIWMLQHTPQINLNPTTFWSGYALFLITLIFHELGHASACVRYGAQPGDIGFTLYMIYPAFYSDVSSAWQLKRWQRIIVDIGGVFFQFIIGVIYAIAFFLSGWQPLVMAFFLILGSCLFSLNPIFKFDGYWIVADALGVTNLSQQPRRILQTVFARICNKPFSPLPWPVWVTSLLIIYTFCFVSFWFYFVWFTIPFLWQHVRDYPLLFTTFMHALLSSSSALTANDFYTFLFHSFIVFTSCLILFRLGMRFLQPALLLLKRAPK